MRQLSDSNLKDETVICTLCQSLHTCGRHTAKRFFHYASLKCSLGMVHQSIQWKILCICISESKFSTACNCMKTTRWNTSLYNMAEATEWPISMISVPGGSIIYHSLKSSHKMWLLILANISTIMIPSSLLVNNEWHSKILTHLLSFAWVHFCNCKIPNLLLGLLSLFFAGDSKFKCWISVHVWHTKLLDLSLGAHCLVKATLNYALKLFTSVTL